MLWASDAADTQAPTPARGYPFFNPVRGADVPRQSAVAGPGWIRVIPATGATANLLLTHGLVYPAVHARPGYRPADAVRDADRARYDCLVVREHPSCVARHDGHRRADNRLMHRTTTLRCSCATPTQAIGPRSSCCAHATSSAWGARFKGVIRRCGSSASTGTTTSWAASRTSTTLRQSSAGCPDLYVADGRPGARALTCVPHARS